MSTSPQNLGRAIKLEGINACLTTYMNQLFFSVIQKVIIGHTLGVCPFTFPARARDPCTFPPNIRTSTSRDCWSVAQAERTLSFSRGRPPQKRTRSASFKLSKAATWAWKQNKMLRYWLYFNLYIKVGYIHKIVTKELNDTGLRHDFRWSGSLNCSIELFTAWL